MEVEVRTGGSEVVRDLGAEIEAFLGEEDGDGLLHVWVPHATAGPRGPRDRRGQRRRPARRPAGAAAARTTGGGTGTARRGHGRDHVLPALCPPYASVPVVDGPDGARHLAVGVPGRPQRRQPGAAGPAVLPAGLSRPPTCPRTARHPGDGLRRGRRDVWTTRQGTRPRGGGHVRPRGRHRVTATADNAGGDRLAGRLGLRAGQVVQELGYDDDCDDTLRAAVAELHRQRPGRRGLRGRRRRRAAVVAGRRRRPGRRAGRLADLPRRRRRGLAAHPKAGRPGHVEPGDIGDAAPTAGLHQTSSISAAPDWSGTRLVTRRSVASRSGQAREAAYQPADAPDVAHRGPQRAAARAGPAPPRRSVPARAAR